MLSLRKGPGGSVDLDSLKVSPSSALHPTITPPSSEQMSGGRTLESVGELKQVGSLVPRLLSFTLRMVTGVLHCWGKGYRMRF